MYIKACIRVSNNVCTVALKKHKLSYWCCTCYPCTFAVQDQTSAGGNLIGHSCRHQCRGVVSLFHLKKKNLITILPFSHQVHDSVKPWNEAYISKAQRATMFHLFCTNWTIALLENRQKTSMNTLNALSCTLLFFCNITVVIFCGLEALPAIIPARVKLAVAECYIITFPHDFWPLLFLALVLSLWIVAVHPTLFHSDHAIIEAQWFILFLCISFRHCAPQDQKQKKHWWK